MPGSTFRRAVASSTFNANYPASAVIDGDRQARNWGAGGGWNDATENAFGSDWLQVNFAGTRTINAIEVFTLRDGFASNSSDPTLTETFNSAINGAQYNKLQCAVLEWRHPGRRAKRSGPVQ